MKKFFAIFTCILLVAGIFSACGGNNTNVGNQTTGSDNSSMQNSSGNAEYAVILKALSDDFWVSMKEGIEQQAAELGVKVDVFAAQDLNDSAGQLTILENCLTKGYKAIGVCPVSPTNLINGIVHANQKGIYVMNLDEKVDIEALKKAGGNVIGFATTDNFAVGEKAAKFIAAQLGEEGGDVAIIEGKAGNATGESRKAGAKKGFDDADDIDLVASQPADWDRQKAMDIATGYIQMYKDLKAIYCCNDTMALGALQAVINAGKLSQIMVVGTDGTSEAVKSVRAGQLSATVAQDAAEMGAAAMRKMVEAVKESPKFDTSAIPDEIPIDSYIVTKDNAD